MRKRLVSLLHIDDSFSYFLVLTLVCYLYKTAFWPITYIFIICYAILVTMFLVRSDWNLNIRGFIRDFLPPVILFTIFLLVFLINGYYSNNTVKKDILLIFVLFSLFFFLYWNNTYLNKRMPLAFTVDFIIATTFVISILNLLNLLFFSAIPSVVSTRLHISGGPAIGNDYNFYSLFMLFGIFILNFKNLNIVLLNRYPKVVSSTLTLLFVLNIILAGSRRGIIILLLLLLIYIIYELRSFRKGLILKKVLKRVLVFCGIIFVLISTAALIFLIIPKQKLSFLVNKYSMLAGIDDLRPIERFLWNNDPRVPSQANCLIDKNSLRKSYGFWNYLAAGTVHSYIETPYGAGIKVIREEKNNAGIIFYYIGPRIIYYANHTYKISFKAKFLKGDFSSLNVGWYVDDGSKGISNTFILDKVIEPLGDDWYNCSAKYTFIDNHSGLMGFISSGTDQTSFILSGFELVDIDYNPKLPRFEFEYTGKEDLESWIDGLNHPWVDLNLINNGDFAHDLGFWKQSADSLKIKIEDVDGRKCAIIRRGNGNGGGWSLYYSGRNIEYLANNKYQLTFKTKLITPKTIPFSVGFWIDEGSGFRNKLDLKIDTLKNDWLNITAAYTFKTDQKSLFFPINNQIDNSEFYITDLRLVNLTQTQYQKPASRQTEEKVKTEVAFSDRTLRWQYSKESWNSEYRWYNKLFGHGFDYLEWFGTKFLKQPGQLDYPHNPLISILLYSGILGFILYLWLIYEVISLYYKYRIEYGLLFFCFGITYFFSFFSGGNPFDPPIMGFFVLLPFFLNSVHKMKIN